MEIGGKSVVTTVAEAISAVSGGYVDPTTLPTVMLVMMVSLIAIFHMFTMRCTLSRALSVCGWPTANAG